MNRKSLAAIAALSLAAFTLPAEAAGSGVFTVRNALSLTITPYFRSNCWAAGTPDSKTWVDFGNIGAGGQFGWEFTDPGLINPACKHPRVEFTYGFGHGPESAPSKHVPRSRLYVFNPNPTDDDEVTIGGVLIGKDDD